jgi:hypothetical protein
MHGWMDGGALLLLEGMRGRVEGEGRGRGGERGRGRGGKEEKGG